MTNNQIHTPESQPQQRCADLEKELASFREVAAAAGRVLSGLQQQNKVLEVDNARLCKAIEKAPCPFKTGLECSSLTGPPYCLPSTKDIGQPYVHCWKRAALEQK